MCTMYMHLTRSNIVGMELRPVWYENFIRGLLAKIVNVIHFLDFIAVFSTKLNQKEIKITYTSIKYYIIMIKLIT